MVHCVISPVQCRRFNYNCMGHFSAHGAIHDFVANFYWLSTYQQRIPNNLSKPEKVLIIVINLANGNSEYAYFVLCIWGTAVQKNQSQSDIFKF